MIRVAMTLPGRGAWTGGENYLRNMLTVVQQRLSGVLEPIVFLTPEENAVVGQSLSGLLTEPPEVSEKVATFGRGAGLKAAIARGVDGPAAAAFIARRCDVVFEPALFYGWRFPLPVVAWMPDFQHRYMRKMFSWSGRTRREIGFRAQIASGRTVMLSSETARRDAEAFYRGARGRTAVVRFAQAVDIAGIVAARAELATRYGLPERFIFLPNQFWKHKNHLLVVDALDEAHRSGVLDKVPPILMSGRQDDVRNPGAYAAFQRRLAKYDVGDRVQHLGLIPYADVVGLVAAADALLNPSLFEGWSTTVEEAKALGTPLAVSDLAIHREQAPGAHFFDPTSAGSLLDTLLAIGAAQQRVRPNVGALIAAHEVRLDAYAAALTTAFTQTVRRD